MNLLDLFERFPDEESATAWVESIRWPNGDRYCPKCGSKCTCETKSRKPMPYWCRDCRSYFSVKTGTVMQSSNLPLRKRAIATFMMMDGNKEGHKFIYDGKASWRDSEDGMARDAQDS